MKLHKLISSLDSMAPGYSLNVEGNERVKTTAGGILNLLNFGTLLAFAVFSFYQYINISRYESVDNTSPIMDKPLPINLVKYRRFPIVKLQNKLTKTEQELFIKASEVYRYVAIWSRVNHWNITKSTSRWTYYKSCAEVYPDYKELFKDVEDLNMTEFEQYYICMPQAEIENITLKGSDEAYYSDGEDYVYLNNFVSPCEMSMSEDPNYCNITDKVLNNLIVYFGFIETKVDLLNYEKPETYYMNWDNWYYLSKAAFSYYALDVVVNTIRDDRGPLFSIKERERFTSLKSMSTSTSPILEQNQRLRCNSSKESCTSYMNIVLESSLTSTDSLRVYKPITEVLGTIGGVKEIIFLVFSYIHLFLVGNNHKLYIVQKVFGIVPSEKKILCCKKKKGEIGKTNSRGSYYVASHIIDQAYAKVLNSVDICALTSELFIVQFLASALLQDFQLTLMPWVALNHFGPDKKDKDAPPIFIGKDLNSSAEEKKQKLRYQPTPADFNSERQAKKGHPLRFSFDDQSPSKDQDQSGTELRRGKTKVEISWLQAKEAASMLDRPSPVDHWQTVGSPEPSKKHSVMNRLQLEFSHKIQELMATAKITLPTVEQSGMTLSQVKTQPQVESLQKAEPVPENSSEQNPNTEDYVRKSYISPKLTFI